MNNYTLKDTTEFLDCVIGFFVNEKSETFIAKIVKGELVCRTCGKQFIENDEVLPICISPKYDMKQSPNFGPFICHNFVCPYDRGLFFDY